MCLGILENIFSSMIYFVIDLLGVTILKRIYLHGWVFQEHSVEKVYVLRLV